MVESDDEFDGDAPNVAFGGSHGGLGSESCARVVEDRTKKTNKLDMHGMRVVSLKGCESEKEGKVGKEEQKRREHS